MTSCRTVHRFLFGSIKTNLLAANLVLPFPMQ
jgi:hypothetical protein